MTDKTAVEMADRKSRLRPFLFALATVAFLVAQLITRPSFDRAGPAGRPYAWTVNAALLMVCLASGGFLRSRGRVRALLNDEVAHVNYRRACTAAYWIASLVAMVTFAVPSLRKLTGQQVSFLVVTTSLSAAMLLFSWWEYRAHADA